MKTAATPLPARPRWRARLRRRGDRLHVDPDQHVLAVVTMTTVGYGDIAPRTPVGQLLAALLMILGYGIIAVPTGIVTVELASASRPVSRQACPGCSAGGHDMDARHCKHCGARL